MIVALSVLATILSGLNQALAVKQEAMDMYVFAYSWQPEFCYGKTDYYGCENPKDYWNSHFTIHGLWPQYSSGGYPSTCTSEAFDSTVPYTVGWEDMTTYWPNAQYAETDPDYSDFWEHEWSKHGTCSGLSQVDYFNTTIYLLKQLGTPTDYSEAVGSTISADTLREDFGGATYASLQCTSSVYVNGVYTCWSQSNGIPVAQITCPSDVQSEDTCTGSTLNVESF